MSRREIDLLSVDKGGLLIVGLPRVSEVVIQMLSRKTGRNAAELIGVALENLANKVLEPDDKKELIRLIKEQVS